MQCAEALRVQAFFDNELDAVSSADIERHLEHCAACRALLHDLAEVRVAIRRDLAFERAAPVLRARVLQALDDEASSLRRPMSSRLDSQAQALILGGCIQRRRRHGDCGGIGAVLHRAVIHQSAAGWSGECARAIFDAGSFDRCGVHRQAHGEAVVCGTCRCVAGSGRFPRPRATPLVGGRADYFEGQRAAVTVYRHGAHTINVFSWAASGILPRDSTRNGYHLAFFREGNLDYCAVSDTGWDELHGLVTLLKDLSQRENTG